MNGTAKTRKKSRIEQLSSENQLLKEQNRMLSEELDRMRSNLEWFKRQFFGAKCQPDDSNNPYKYGDIQRFGHDVPV